MKKQKQVPHRHPATAAGWVRDDRLKLRSDALDVAAFGGVDFDFVAVIDEGRDVDDEAGLERCGLHDGAGGGLLQSGLSAGDGEVDGVGKKNAHWLAFVKFDADGKIGDEVVSGVAESVFVQGDLFVSLQVHEVVAAIVGIEEFEFDFVHDGALDEIFSAEAIIDNRAGAEIAHLGLHGAALVARGAVLDAENGVEVAFVLDDHAGAQLCRFYHLRLLILFGNLPACRSVWKLVPRIAN